MMRLLFISLLLPFVFPCRAQETLIFEAVFDSVPEPFSRIVYRLVIKTNHLSCTVGLRLEDAPEPPTPAPVATFSCVRIEGPQDAQPAAISAFYLEGDCNSWPWCIWHGEFDLSPNQVAQLRDGLWSLVFCEDEAVWIRLPLLLSCATQFLQTNSISFTVSNPSLAADALQLGLTGDNLSYRFLLPIEAAPYEVRLSYSEEVATLLSLEAPDCVEPNFSQPVPTCVFTGSTCVPENLIVNLLAGSIHLSIWSRTTPAYSVHGPILPVDSDRDGVADYLDQCPSTPSGAVVNADGCSIDQLCPRDGPWRSHGEYLKHLRTVTSLFLKDGLITPAEARAILKHASRSQAAIRRGFRGR